LYEYLESILPLFLNISCNSGEFWQRPPFQIFLPYWGSCERIGEGWLKNLQQMRYVH